MTRLKRLVLLTAAVLASATGAASAAVPSNTAAPTMSGLVNSVYAAVGSPLTCGTGTWTGSPTSYEYEWFRDSDSVSTAGNTYTPVEADRGRTITCWVTASNNDGSDFALAAGQPMVPAVASINVTGQPAAKIASGASAAVEYTSTYWTTVTTCLLDSVSIPCASPITAAGLADGQHTISITAKNWADELRTFSYTFMVGEPVVAPELAVGPVDAMYVGEEAQAQISTDATSMTCAVDGAPTGCAGGLVGFYAPNTPGEHVLSVTATSASGGSTTKTVPFTLKPVPDMSRAFAASVTVTVGGARGVLKASLPAGWQTGCASIGGPVRWNDGGTGVATNGRIGDIGDFFCNYNGGPVGAPAGDNGLEVAGTAPGTEVLTIPIVRRNLKVNAKVTVISVLPTTTPKQVALGGVTSSKAPLSCEPATAGPFSWSLDAKIVVTLNCSLPAKQVPENGIVGLVGNLSKAGLVASAGAPAVLVTAGERLTALVDGPKLASSTTRKRTRKISVKVLSSGRQKADVSVYSIKTTGKGAAAKYRYKRVFRKRLTVKRGTKKVAVKPALTGNYKVVISVLSKKGKVVRSLTQYG